MKYKGIKPVSQGWYKYNSKIEKAPSETPGPPCGEWHSDRLNSPKFY